MDHYFENYYYRFPAIKKAFEKNFIPKMLKDGYADVSAYVHATIKREAMLGRLLDANSEFFSLYEAPYPTQENICTFCETCPPMCANSPRELTNLEADAIIYWLYQTFSTENDRIRFTMDLLSRIKELHRIANHSQYCEGVVYNAEKLMKPEFISSVEEMTSFAESLKKNGYQLYYRGHSLVNHRLLPSVMRSTSLQAHESDLYYDLLRRCPSEFSNCETTLERLTIMQHYGLPTRMFDITKNPLVALYFASESHKSDYGEVLIFSEDIRQQPQIQLSSILAALATLSSEEHSAIYRRAENIASKKRLSENQRKNLFCDFTDDTNPCEIDELQQEEYAVKKLLRMIRVEHPNFDSQIDPMLFFDGSFVHASRNNPRIMHQEGDFLLCGDIYNEETTSFFRYRKIDEASRCRKAILCIIKNKDEILQQLESLENHPINKAFLFPEIECVSEYLCHKYEGIR